MIWFGEMTMDEMFVTAGAAKSCLVLLKHFGPGNPEAARLVS